MALHSSEMKTGEEKTRGHPGVRTYRHHRMAPSGATDYCPLPQSEWSVGSVREVRVSSTAAWSPRSIVASMSPLLEEANGADGPSRSGAWVHAALLTTTHIGHSSILIDIQNRMQPVPSL